MDRPGERADQPHRQLERHIANLTPEAEALYRNLHRQFHKLMTAAYHEAYSPPERIGEVIVDALDASRPKPRYLPGADAEQFYAYGQQSVRQET
ncbi:Rossmann-fold NAD(P)-binding domain-containing protein [Rhizorhabdus argentea]|uniref:hypothetical protein n=1 Tax=Rhizorhabdus argentea TaxID=1387174 RepID=UPI0030EE4CBB